MVVYMTRDTFQNTDYGLLVLLPDKKDAPLEDVIGKLAGTTLEKLLEATSMKPAFVTMPCFQSNNITHLKTIMQRVKLPAVFFFFFTTR